MNDKYLTFYLKYRPQTIDELDIKEVRESLAKIVKSGKIPHAFLFAGPKGTGKTSAARILAKIVNCENIGKSMIPCDKCEQCRSIIRGNNLDVIELDAASHRGIDDIRALREVVKLAPIKARKKVYIIDEAHMLTLEASNALLKTLEEPPDHVFFILATTNPEKLIETIRSRAVLIRFRKADIEETVSSLQKIVRKEKIKIPEESLKLIAQSANGSFRDAQKIFEQLITEKKNYDFKNVEEFLLKAKDTEVYDFILSLFQRDSKKAIEDIERMVEKGISMEVFLQKLMETFKNGLLAKVGIGSESTDFSKEDLIVLIDLFTNANTQLKNSPIEQLPVEVAVVKWCGKEEEKTLDGEKEDKTFVEKENLVKKEKLLAETIKTNIIQKISQKAETFSEMTEECWKTILSRIKPINISIEALLRATRPIGMEGNVLKLGVFYRFHKERLEETKNKTVFEDVVASVLGRPIKVVCSLAEPLQKKIEEPKKVESVLTEEGDKDIIKVAEEIFST